MENEVSAVIVTIIALLIFGSVVIYAKFLVCYFEGDNDDDLTGWEFLLSWIPLIHLFVILRKTVIRLNKEKNNGI